MASPFLDVDVDAIATGSDDNNTDRTGTSHRDRLRLPSSDSDDSGLFDLSKAYLEEEQGCDPLHSPPPPHGDSTGDAPPRNVAGAHDRCQSNSKQLLHMHSFLLVLLFVFCPTGGFMIQHCTSIASTRISIQLLIGRPQTQLYGRAAKRKSKNKRNNRSDDSRSTGISSGTNRGIGSGTGFHANAEPGARARASSPKVPPRRIRALKKLCDEPLIFTIDDFVSPELIEALLMDSDKGTPAAADEARLHFATLVAGELFSGQWSMYDGLRFNSASSSDANNNDIDDNDDDDASSPAEKLNCPEGLHVDTNNDSMFRSVTAILYLNDIDSKCGGATVFPLANAPEDDPALLAARRLMDGGLTHTRGASGSIGILPKYQRDALLLERTVASVCGLRVQPQAARLCIFFSRTSDGEMDARSWHCGERLLHPDEGSKAFRNDGDVTEKQILTLFKEVDYVNEENRPDIDTFDKTSASASFEAYLAPQIAAQRKVLLDLAMSHAQYFETN